MNEEFALKNEEKDYFLLKDFNKVLKLSDLGQTPKYSTSDASGTSLNRYINIELKRRNQTLTKDFKISGETYTADTVYLESHKAGDMLLDFVCEDKIPLYINFLNDGYVLLFNLSKLKHRPKKVCKKIYSKLYQGFELAKREELLVSDAWIYKRINNEYKLIHKP